MGATALFIDGGGQLFLADNRGVHRSRDGGARWNQLNRGLQDLLAVGRKAGPDYVNTGYRFGPGAGSCTLLLASPVGLFGLNQKETWVQLTDRRPVLEAIPTPTGLCLRVQHKWQPFLKPEPRARDSRIVCDARPALPCD